MRTALVIVAVVLLIGIVIIFIAIGDRNQLVQEREAITSQWAQVDAALQHRAELIPNIVDTVRDYGNEAAIIKDVTDARTALAGARTPQDRIQANSALDTALSRLLVAAEKYRQLKSNEDFVRFQDELAATENHIAIERRKYNEAVQRYNTDIELFPKNIAAAMFGFERIDAYFKTEPGGRVTPHAAP